MVSFLEARKASSCCAEGKWVYIKDYDMETGRESVVGFLVRIISYQPMSCARSSILVTCQYHLILPCVF